MAPLVAACEAADPTFFVSPGERARWLAADVEALRAAIRAGVTEPDLDQDAVAAISAPTLIYAGTRDDLERKERTTRMLPTATFVALDGLDHAAAFGRSDLVLPHVRAFLGRVAASAS